MWVSMRLRIILTSTMNSRTKFQNHSFVRYIVSGKNIKGTLLSLEPHHNDLKINKIFYLIFNGKRSFFF